MLPSTSPVAPNTALDQRLKLPPVIFVGSTALRPLPNDAPVSRLRDRTPDPQASLERRIDRASLSRARILSTLCVGKVPLAGLSVRQQATTSPSSAPQQQGSAPPPQSHVGVFGKSRRRQGINFAAATDLCATMAGGTTLGLLNRQIEHNELALRPMTVLTTPPVSDFFGDDGWDDDGRSHHRHHHLRGGGGSPPSHLLHLARESVVSSAMGESTVPLVSLEDVVMEREMKRAATSIGGMHPPHRGRRPPAGVRTQQQNKKNNNSPVRQHQQHHRSGEELLEERCLSRTLMLRLEDQAHGGASFAPAPHRAVLPTHHPSRSRRGGGRGGAAATGGVDSGDLPLCPPPSQQQQPSTTTSSLLMHRPGAVAQHCGDAVELHYMEALRAASRGAQLMPSTPAPQDPMGTVRSTMRGIFSLITPMPSSRSSRGGVGVAPAPSRPATDGLTGGEGNAEGGASFNGPLRPQLRRTEDRHDKDEENEEVVGPVAGPCGKKRTPQPIAGGGDLSSGNGRPPCWTSPTTGYSFHVEELISSIPTTK